MEQDAARVDVTVTRAPEPGGVLLLGPMPTPPQLGGIANGIELLRRTALARSTGMGFVNTFVPPDPGRSLWRRLRNQADAYRRFLVTLRRTRPGLVHIKTSAGVNFYQNAGYALLARGCGYPTLMQVHDGTFPEFYSRAGRLGRRCIRFLLCVPNDVLALSEGWAKYFRTTLGLAGVGVVPNGLPTAIFREAQPDRGGLGFPADRLTVAFVGTASAELDYKKGFREVVDAVAAVRRTRRDVLLVVAGGASHTELLTETLGARGDGWLDLGPVDAAQKPVLFRSVDVFVLPSHAENMPNTLLEAMAAGCAVIATPVGAVAEMIADEGNGLLVPVGDVAALARSVTRLAGDPALRARLGARAAEDAAACYDLRNVETALAAAYESNAPGITRLC